VSARIHVAVGVIYNPNQDKVLITKRTTGQHLSGFWEFPGGKVEKNEDVFTALARELNEELGINVEEASRLTSISYDYPDKKVLLDVWQVNKWSGTAESKEKQQLAWVLINQLNNYAFPTANQYIIQSLFLSSTYLISQNSYADYSELLNKTEEYFSAGLKLFQLRLDTMGEAEFSILIEKLYRLSSKNNAKLILNGLPSDIGKYNIDGLHLKSSLLDKYDSRPIAEDYILGASCHNEKELLLADKINVNYAFLSPVLKTTSHPGQVAMGWDSFYKLSNKVNFPVYSLGGMKLTDLDVAKLYNAHGIAMINAIWNSVKPIKEFPD